MSEEKKNIDPVFTSSVTDTEVHVFTEQAWQNYKKEEEERREYIHKKIFKIGSIALFLLVMFIFASIAWFTMNRETSTSGMSMTVDGAPFELAVTGNNEGAISYIQTGKGENATYDEGTLLNDMTGGINAGDGSVDTYSYINDVENRTTDTGSFYTTGSDDLIKWRLNSTYNATDDGLGPASCGEFTFYVIPKRSGNLTVTCSLKLEGYAATVNQNENKTFNASNLRLLESDDVNYEAVTYLNSHLLFFTGRTGEGTAANPYRYTGLVDKDEIPLTFNNCTVDVLEPVTLYWVWANTFADMTCIAQNSSLSTDNATVSDLRDYVLDDPEKILKGINKATATGYMTASGSFDATTTANNLTTLSMGYNKADQSIGTNISYFLLVLSAK